MAIETGTVLGHNALMDSLKIFLLAQNWTVEKEEFLQDGRYVYFKGPDILTGTITINAHINIRLFESVPGDYYNWEISGAIGFDANEPFYGQPQSNPLVNNAIPIMPLYQHNIDYRFIANNRRFIVIAKISTVFTSMYAGFILPYATPSEYPYPIFIGATTRVRSYRFSNDTYWMGGFYDPSFGCAYIRHFDGEWIMCANYTDIVGNKSRQAFDAYIWPYRSEVNDKIINNVDGSYTLLPCIVLTRINGGDVYGELDGVFACSGFSNSAENTVTHNGIVYDVIQTANRSAVDDYVCIRMT
jgi:hypothetical protein